MKLCKNINNLTTVLETRLVPIFDYLDKEADNIYDNSMERQYQEFIPIYENDIPDEAEAYENAMGDAVEYWSMNKEIQQYFLNMTVVWLFHLFEKESKVIFTFKIEQNKQIIEKKLKGENIK